jgi:hypothetical protein
VTAKRLQDKVAVVTGSTSGIGEGIARTFAAEGAAVVVSGRRAERGEAVAQTIRAAGGRAVFQQTDLKDPEQCRRLCLRARQEFGGLDTLVNNAGIFPRASFEEITVELWDEIFQVNLRGAFLCSQAAVGLMRDRGGGSIVNMGSGHAFGCWEKLIHYGTSKTALYAMTMHLARALARDQIRVNWITVGWVLTEKERETEAGDGNDADKLAEIGERLPMGGFDTVEEMAAACVYLASDEAARITGSNVNASGGMCVRI